MGCNMYAYAAGTMPSIGAGTTGPGVRDPQALANPYGHGAHTPVVELVTG